MGGNPHVQLRLIARRETSRLYRQYCRGKCLASRTFLILGSREHRDDIVRIPLQDRVTLFHCNVRYIPDLCFPHQSFEEQLRRTWRTNSVLCSAQVEGGSILRPIEDICIQTYLRKQLALMPNALGAALGGGTGSSQETCDPILPGRTSLKDF